MESADREMSSYSKWVNLCKKESEIHKKDIRNDRRGGRLKTILTVLSKTAPRLFGVSPTSSMGRIHKRLQVNLNGENACKLKPRGTSSKVISRSRLSVIGSAISSNLSI